MNRELLRWMYDQRLPQLLQSNLESYIFTSEEKKQLIEFEVQLNAIPIQNDKVFTDCIILMTALGISDHPEAYDSMINYVSDFYLLGSLCQYRLLQLLETELTQVPSHLSQITKLMFVTMAVLDRIYRHGLVEVLTRPSDLSNLHRLYDRCVLLVYRLRAMIQGGSYQHINLL